MVISIFGLGYVGCVSAGCLAQNGFKVIGVDVNETKVDLINRGIATIIEKDIDRIVKEQHVAGNLTASSDYLKAVEQSEVSIICVGTPSTEQGSLNLSYIYETARQIGKGIAQKTTFHTILIRSTVLPGTNAEVGRIVAESSGKTRNEGFAIVSNPEFLREGTAVEDYYNPPLTVIGTDSDLAYDVVASLYEKVSGPIERVDIKVAEIIKYVNNSYHALKVSFGNEVGNICKKLAIDSHEVMRIFCMDKQLNISTYYFKPGFAYGGSCLPKDLMALKTLGTDMGLDNPVLQSIEDSNQSHIDTAYRLISNKSAVKIGILGVAFKDGTDDLRYSPILKVIECLIQDGKNVRIYDKYVNEALLIGSNKAFIQENLPYLTEMMVDTENDLIEWAELLVFNKKEASYHLLPEKYPQKEFFDLVRVSPLITESNYEGISW